MLSRCRPSRHLWFVCGGVGDQRSRPGLAGVEVWPGTGRVYSTRVSICGVTHCSFRVGRVGLRVLPSTRTVLGARTSVPSGPRM